MMNINKQNKSLQNTVYLALFIGVNFTLFSLTFQQWNICISKYLFYMQIYQKQIPNSAIITILGPDTEEKKEGI